MSLEQAPSFLTLAQFLDLERRWGETGDRFELAHRVCHTIVILLDAQAAALGLEVEGGQYRVLATIGDSGATGPHESVLMPHLAERARSTRTPQLRNLPSSTLAVFPFYPSSSETGCLHVRIPRPALRGTEVSCLRFLASVAAIVLGSTARPVEARSENGPAEGSMNNGEASRLIAMVVHDLRNPLGVLAGYASALASSTLGPLNEEQQSAVRAIDRQVQVLTSSVEELLDIDRGQRLPRAQNVARFNLLDFFSELRSTRFAHLDARIVWPGPESRFDFVGDRRRIASIVQNLLDNAIKHGGPGLVRVDCTRRNAQLVIAVADRGPALPAEIRLALTEPSRTADVFTAGLGMHIIRRHLRHLAASVVVREGLEGGNEIEVTIPASAPGVADSDVPR
jgi:signal transduction histidine kinase